MDLKILGFSSYEEMAYKSLINLGKSTSAAISQDSDVPYGKIYPTLASLENKGLVKVIPEKTKKFIASDPKSLIELIDKKKKEMNDIKNSIKDLKIVYDSNPGEAITVIKGKKNFYKVVQEMPTAKKSDYTIKYSSELKGDWINEIRNYKRRKVNHKVLVRFDKETKDNVLEWTKHHKSSKRIDNEGVAMSIIDDDFMFLTMINPNTTIIICDKATIKILKLLFESYYGGAGSIE